MKGKQISFRERGQRIQEITGITPPFFFVGTGWVMDLPRFDRELSEHNPDYNFEKCTYKGENYSMRDYVKEVYGKELEKLLILPMDEEEL